MSGVRTVICALLLAGVTAAEQCEPLPGAAVRCHLTTLDAGPVNVTRPGSLRRLELVCSNATHVSHDFSVALGSAFTELRELSVSRCALGHLRRGVFHRLRRLQTLRLRTFSREWTAAEMQLERGCFDGLVHLETLDLSGNNMWSLERDVLEDLTSLKVLNLSGNSFQDLAELRGSGVGSGLRVLDVSYNSLMELSAAGLRSFPELRQLQARHNELAVIRDGALRDLRRLEALDVSDNRLVALPAMMLNETRLLRELHVQNNSIRVLPPSLLSDLPQLQTVNMSGNNLSSEWIRKDTFAGLLRLIVLDLSANQLDALSVDVFQDLTSLQSLDLSDNLLETLPDGVFVSLSNLHTLRLSGNLLRRLGRRALTGLHVLSALRLDGNRLAQLDELTFANVTSVQELRLDGNQFLNVPLALAKLTFLAGLDLGNNFISQLPDGAFSTLRQLSALRLAGNQLVNVSARALEGTVALNVLDLSRNRLTLIESGALDDLRELRVARIDANRLASINGLFAKLPQFLWLNASDNRIEFFDYALMPTGMRWLDLHRNQIREIGNFYRLEDKIELRTLDLSHNQVSHIGRSAVPDGIEYFILAGNRLETVEPGTFEAKRRLVRADLSANQLSSLDAQSVRLPDDHGDQPADLLLGGNPLLCDCDMDWLLKTATGTAPAGHQYRILDADRIMCRLLHSPVGLVPLLETKPADFLCTYERHCFALCHCCNYVACDCEMKCPDGCSCYHDHTWNTNMVECSARERVAISRELPMDATAVFAAGNNIHSLESHTFIGRKRIQQLYVNNSNVEEIRNRSLNGLSALQVLRLENNLLSELHGYEFDSLRALRELYLHNNRLRRIHPATFSRLRALEVLTLHGNLLVSFPVWRLSSPYLVELTLASNPWSCECHIAEPLAAYVRDHRAKIVDADAIQCEYVSSWPRCSGGGLTATPAGAGYSVRRGSTARGVPLLAVLGGTAFVVAAVVAALVFRFRSRLCTGGGGGESTAPPAKTALAPAETTVTRDADKLYDVFVTYSAQDTRFVSEVLAPELEHATPACNVCLLRRDAPSTGYLGDAVHHCVRSSRRTLLVVSRSFLDHEWCRFDFKSSHLEALRGSRAVVGVLVGVERHHMEAELRDLLRPSDCVRYGGPDFWRRLRALLPTGHGLKALYGLGPPPTSPQPPPPAPPPPGESPSPTCSTVVSEDRSVGPLHGRSDSSHALVYSAQAPHNTSYSSLRPSEHTYMTIDHYHTLARPSAPTESELYCTLEPEVQPQMPSDPAHPDHPVNLGHQTTHSSHPSSPSHPGHLSHQGLQGHPVQQGFQGHRGHVIHPTDHAGHLSQTPSQQPRGTPVHSLWV